MQQNEGMNNEEENLARTVGGIGETVIVLSGKGGVGKSTVAVNVASALAAEGYSVGLLDVDIHGPSTPTMLGLNGRKADTGAGRILPLKAGGVSVLSLAFLLDGTDDAVIWRGPMKAGVIKQLLSEVEWGPLDVLVVDCPPGTGDEPLSIVQLLPERRHALVVTTPQEVAASDVRRSLTFCRKLSLPVLGVVENMSGFTCPHCGTVTDIFKSGGGRKIADNFGVPFLGKLPIDPAIADSGDSGKPFARHLESVAGAAIGEVIKPVLALLDKKDLPAKDKTMMKIAIPTAGGKLCSHFGHCESFSVIEIDPATNAIGNRSQILPPPHEPGVLPEWLGTLGINVIIAGGMGQHALSLFAARNITVRTGAPAGDPEELVRQYLAGTLATGNNSCDH